MIYESAEEQVKENKQQQQEIIRLAEVTSLDNGKRAKVKFFGEDTEAGKTYTYIDGYIPKVGDKVAMIKQGNTFIILGKVTAEEVIVRYALAEHSHEDYAAKEHTHEEYAAKEHSHSPGNVLENGDYSVTLDESGRMIPGKTNTVSLGKSGLLYKAIYTGTVDTETLTVNGTEMDDVDLKYPYKVFDSSSRESSQRTYHNVRLTDDILYPAKTNTISMGTSSYVYKNGYFNTLYSGGAAVTTSDKRKKKFIKNISDKYMNFFRKLRPVCFQYKDGTSGRTHTGFIAQEVEKAMKENNISNEEFAGLVIQENGKYGLRYEEFIAIQTAAIQELQDKVEELERRVGQ